MDYSTGSLIFQGVEYDHAEDPVGSPWSYKAVQNAPAIVRKPPATRQNRETRSALVDQAESAFGSLTDAEIKAGATARAEIDKARRFNAVAGTERDRETVARMCVGHRNGILRCLHVLEGDTWIPEMTDRVRVAVDHILALSANASVLSRSKWPATKTWLSKNLPIIAQDHAAWLESEFARHLSDAQAKIADRTKIRLSDYRTAPKPAQIAEDLNITIDVLRQARANTIGLTSVNPEAKRDRDRRTAMERRRANGSRPRSECTKTADDRRLAVELDCEPKSLRRHRKAGTLVEFIAKRRALIAKRQNVQLSSPG